MLLRNNIIMAGEENNNLFDDFDFSIFGEGETTDVVTGETDIDTTTKENTEESTEEISQEETDNESMEDTDSSDSKETNDTGTTEEDDSSEDTDDNSSPLLPYAKLLVDEGILPGLNLEEFDGTSTGLMDAMNKEINEGISYYKSSLPEEISKLVDNYEEGVPLNTLLQIDNQRKQYNAIKEDQLVDNKDLQKALIKDLYKQTTKFSEEKIDKLIQRSDDLDDLEEEAKSSLTDLVTLQDEYEAEALEKAKQDRLNAEKKQKESLDTFKNTLEKYDEIIPGVKVNKNIKDSIVKTMTTPVAQDEYGNPINEITKYKLENPYTFDITLSYLYNVTKGFSDWSVLSASGKKAAIKDFETSVKKHDTRATGNVSKTRKSETTNADILGAIEKFNLGK